MLRLSGLGGAPALRQAFQGSVTIVGPYSVCASVKGWGETWHVVLLRHDLWNNLH